MATYTNTYYATLCSRTYNGTANRYPNSSGTESPAATHGYYGSNGNWIGMVLLPVYLSGYSISGITLRMTANSAGTSSNKTVYIYSSNYQTTSASGKGSIYPDELLGSISGVFRSQTTTVQLSGSLLSNVAEYLGSGKQMLILYDPTASESNYCRFTSVEATITYSDPVSFTWPNKTVSVSQTGKQVKVSWNAASGSGGSGNIMYYLFAGSDDNCVYSGTGLTCTFTPPAYDTQVAYYVYAEYSGIGLWSTTAYYTASGVTLSAPGTPSVEYANGVFSLSWDKSTGANGNSGDTITYVVYYGDAQNGFAIYTKSAGTSNAVDIAQWIEGVECRFFVRASYSGKTADSYPASYTIPAHRTVMYCLDGEYIECIVMYCEDGQTYEECIPSYCEDGQTYVECSH